MEQHLVSLPHRLKWFLVYIYSHSNYNPLKMETMIMKLKRNYAGRLVLRTNALWIILWADLFKTFKIFYVLLLYFSWWWFLIWDRRFYKQQLFRPEGESFLLGDAHPECTPVSSICWRRFSHHKCILTRKLTMKSTSLVKHPCKGKLISIC